MTQPLVSIIVPVYNDAAFLSVALQSIASQTLRDFEVVISDDCSSDNSREIAEEFVRRDPRFRLRINPVNLGMTRNWNCALQEACGQYIAKLDADDAIREETLAHLVAAMEGKELPIVANCRTLSCDKMLQPFCSYRGEWAMIRSRMDPLSVHCLPGHVWYRMSFDDIQIWHSNAQLHRREHLLGMGGWDESWGCAPDTDLILRILEQNESVCHVPYTGVLYRHRPGSVSDQYRRQGWLHLESSLIHLNSLARYYARHGRLTPQMKKDWWRLWQNWRNLQANGYEELCGLREDIRERLHDRTAMITPPPWRIRLEGVTRKLARSIIP